MVKVLALLPVEEICSKLARASKASPFTTTLRAPVRELHAGPLWKLIRVILEKRVEICAEALCP